MSRPEFAQKTRKPRKEKRKRRRGSKEGSKGGGGSGEGRRVGERKSKEEAKKDVKQEDKESHHNDKPESGLSFSGDAQANDHMRNEHRSSQFFSWKS
ncbi:hypothetical protein TELCIR_03897 [Teladorsagia circumcincta]|uniref:Uncharacterized protein n=1 Tax=Teladorsagia circumcincta TaxID=45464 RepID=A0A2G9UVA3_TELCI|nr:hypothetical protein TELCIR_03897 [Teladorsagia circumcincta]